MLGLLEERTGWTIRVADRVNQQAILQLVSELLPEGVALTRSPSIDLTARTVRLYTSGPVPGEKAKSLDTDVIYETATATNVLQWMHRAAAFPYRVILYDVPIRLGFLRRGDLVLLTDPEIHLFDYLAFVRDIAWIDGRPRLSLVLIDDPPREGRNV